MQAAGGGAGRGADKAAVGMKAGTVAVMPKGIALEFSIM